MSALLAIGVVLGPARADEAADVSAGPQRARHVAVAAAADLKFALDDLLAELRGERPEIEVAVTYGSSGNFFSQLSNHAPFDVFLSADAELPRKLESQGLAAPGSVFLYAVGRIVLWVPRASPLDLGRGMAVLEDGSIAHVAIANPQHAPYGRAAEAALRSSGVYERVQGKLVLGENVSQTAQFVQSGAADVGIIALALALAPTMQRDGRHWEVPVATYPRMDQAGVILEWAQDPAAAGAFRDFLLGPRGRATLARYGFARPAQ